MENSKKYKLIYRAILDAYDKASLIGKLDVTKISMLEFLYRAFKDCNLNLSRKNHRKLEDLYYKLLRDLRKTCPDCNDKFTLFSNDSKSTYSTIKDTRPEPYIKITVDLEIQDFETVDSIMSILTTHIDYLKTLTFDNNPKEDIIVKNDIQYVANWIFIEVEQSDLNDQYNIIDNRLNLDITENFVFYRIGSTLYIFGSRITEIPQENFQNKDLTIIKI